MYMFDFFRFYVSSFRFQVFGFRASATVKPEHPARRGPALLPH